MQHEVERINLTKEQQELKYEKDQPKIKYYRELTDYLLQSKKEHIYDEENFKLTTTLLNLNPEFYTIWNYRREILTNLYNNFNSNEDEKTKLTSIINDDLKLLMSLLKRFPKVYWIWNHRKWCLFKLVELNSVNWEFEFKTINKMLELDQRNFHGWHYRRFIIENLEEQAIKEEKINEIQAQLKILKLNLDEFDYTTSKIQTDFSNFSAWHNRTKLIPRILNLVKVTNTDNELFKNPLNILHNDLEMIKTGIYMSPEDNSVWLYLYWLLTDPIFVNSFQSKENYIKLLEEQISLIREVNDLEIEDSGHDNIGCLKSLIYIKAVLNNSLQKDNTIDEEIKESLVKLIELDELRKGKYNDQLNGIVPIL
ncbi:BET4 [Candida pseudojiufengensis]|uniref:BET4 n=1 Tax=Candida pseudojiufengensis TaxID=497109 RepID=UPI0022255A0C|nr:BET4 [Candida pseudojiufengensis]KAI5960362.1 BET4 [Candida pseudojiufengensis]